jgi:hypothetical protein
VQAQALDRDRSHDPAEAPGEGAAEEGAVAITGIATITISNHGNHIHSISMDMITKKILSQRHAAQTFAIISCDAPIHHGH